MIEAQPANLSAVFAGDMAVAEQLLERCPGPRGTRGR
jgi:hypothetical protein